MFGCLLCSGSETLVIMVSNAMACEVTSHNATVSETTRNLFFTIELKTYLLLKYLQYSGYRSLYWTLLWG